MLNANMLAGIGDWWLQIVAAIVLVVLLVFWKKYRDKQM